ncbi:hypothetical protein AMS68_002082 [Peltaster fructicola]|uniref:amidase n=1 Tax=Peltaster fructicola TaxID=286661 RepID=A0A6H0XPK5_9PEZI|nr:hypothetical protein AMS68_002082 [Peltaster fructicola]
MASTWKDVASRKKEQRQARIPRDWLLRESAPTDNVLDIPRNCGILTDIELDITTSDATTLLDRLAAGNVSSEDVTRAFCKRAAIAQQLTNCLTEIFFEQGIARAKQLDDHLRRYGKPYGPLHGLPISLKDSFKVEGYDACLGVASLCFQPSTTNSALVDLLLTLGAVLYCKTNIPQTLSSLDSHNNIFGRTLNPINRYLTAGGSSGGEGALVAMHGSPLGIGTDVGGSIRVPAMCNGLIGVKPSHGRIPYAGQQSGPKDGSSKISIEATAGPIARSVRDCALFLRIIADNSPNLVDPDVFAQTWQQQQNPSTSSISNTRRTLRVGVVRTDGHVSPLPPIKRLMDEVVGKLKSHVELVEVDATPLLRQCVKAFNGIVSIDGGNAWFDHLESTGEPLSPWLQGRLKRRAAKPVDDILKLQAQRTALQAKFLAVWQQTGGYWRSASSRSPQLDVLISHAAPHPVPPIDRWNTVNYTAAWNLLDYPTGIVPVRAMTDQDLVGEIDDKPLNGWDEVNQKLWTETDRKVYVGSPLSLQIAAPRLQERVLLESMAIISDALRRPSPSSSKL